MITEFYTNKTILITGCTGFIGKKMTIFINFQYLGKVLLEKVLRSLPVVKTIFVGIAPKVSKID